MAAIVKTALLYILGGWLGLMAVVGCQSEPRPENATLEIPSGREPNASVSGSVTYRERIALTPGAMLLVELRDTSYQDAAAELIARQTITDPGQVPIRFKVEYNREDIDSRNTYSVSARIIESDGRLAFTNDTAYDVITRGNPGKVDMLLVLVQPPPNLVEEGTDWRTWVEVPVSVVRANLIPNEREPYLQVEYVRTLVEGCSRLGNETLEVEDGVIRARVTLMQPPPTPWAIDCDAEVMVQDTVLHVDAPLEPGETYLVVVNDHAVASFTLPEPDFPPSIIAESPIDNAVIDILESDPPQYHLRVVSGLPKGSSCTRFNGYEIRREDANRIEVLITHHEVFEGLVVCTADYPSVETVVPLGTDFEPGEEYEVRVNGDTKLSFTAQ